MDATVLPHNQLLLQVIHSIYSDQPVKVVTLANDRLLIEAYGNRQVIRIQTTGSFEVVLEQVIHWIELCLAYSLSPSPRRLHLLQKVAQTSGGTLEDDTLEAVLQQDCVNC
ncbi:MAG: hypothetical protein SFW36_06220 [Leptolyngbyaceae cyanobacterium bins.59]|nr:hypothetical protein [Leptolyngbyaceae cyanobacterium bins.59]